MVEHNLAKVGVASSNLVSRSIFFFFFFFSFVFASNINLKNEYCIEDEEVLYSTFFDKNLPKFEILQIPSLSANFDVPSLHVKAPFSEHNISISDLSSGIITFKRNCNISGKKSLIEDKIKAIYTQTYPCIQIDKVDVFIKTNLPADFKSYRFKDAGINETRLKSANGTIWVLFETTDKRERKFYFSYIIDAFINVFKAKHNMLNDKILSQNDYEVYRVKIENLPSNLISCKIEKNLITKSYIRADSLLTYNQVEIKKDVLKGALIRSYIIDGGLVIGMDTILQEDANIGDKIRVKTNQNKFLDAKLFSKTEAMILK